MENFHKLLQKQIDTHLKQVCIENPSFKLFLQAINASYCLFEQEKRKADCTVPEEKKNTSLYQKVKKELDQKNASIQQLDKSLRKLDLKYQGISNNGDTEDLMLIASYFKRKIVKGKKIKKEFSRNIELLKTLLTNLQSAILVENENQEPIFTNQLYCNTFLLFYQPDKIASSGLSSLSEISGELIKNPDLFKKRIKEIIEKRVIVTNELIETLDNRFLERDYIPIFINSQNKGHLWKYKDVTQRIRTQILLEQSEVRSNLIMNSSLNGIININSTGKIVFWNNEAESLFGWKREEVLGKNLQEIFVKNKKYLNFQLNAMERYFKADDISILNKQIELNVSDKYGNDFPIEIAIIPIKQEDEIFFCSFVQDISERKNAELSLKHQEEKYRNIIANVNLGLIEIDTRGIIRYVNQTFVLMSGYEIIELLEKKTTVFLGHPNHLQIPKSETEAKSQTISEHFQSPITNKDGELRWWTISRAPNYDDNGKLVGFIETYLDITKQKQLEIDLEREKTKAENTSIAKEAFLANMSHEIRTPLNAIIGFLRELEKQELTELQHKYIKNSTIASKHLSAIINNILDISKIEAGEMHLENNDFNLENSLKKISTVLEPKAKEKGIYLLTAISNQVCKVLTGDSLRLEQILFNLVGNAIKFTDKGKISVNCQVVSDSNAAQELCISVSDTGIGMDDFFINSMFKKFSQEDKSVTRKFGGTGLGMAITKELVLLMKGEIKVESKKNHGTTIHITFKFKKGNTLNFKTSETKSNPVMLGNISVLLVEDNEMNRMVVQNSLSYFNCRVTEATDGLQALEILKKKKFDIILMDIQMPRLDGIQATKIIRKELRLDVPIIALTANAFKTEINKCKMAGMNDYITKPFEESALIETITKLLGTQSSIHNFGKSSQELLYNLDLLIEMSKGNKNFVLKMLSIFTQQITETIITMDKAILNNNYNELSRLIHKIKPSIESLAIESIIADLAYLEKAIKSNRHDKGPILSIYDNIKKTLEEVVLQLYNNELKR
jgi:PAS domain S-box-containing protein